LAVSPSGSASHQGLTRQGELQLAIGAALSQTSGIKKRSIKMLRVLTFEPVPQYFLQYLRT
jgi:hypothetical protein